MGCSVCGAATDGTRPYCAGCNAALHPSPGYLAVNHPAVAAGPGGPPVAAAANPASSLISLAVDVLFCACLLAGGLVLSVAVASGRGAAGLTAVIDRLGWLHLVLALVVLAVYRLGAVWLGGRTLGKRSADRLAGRPAVAALSPVPMLIPALVTTAFLGALIGTTVPVGSDTGPSGAIPDVRAETTDAPAPVTSRAGAGGTEPGGGTPPGDIQDQAATLDALLNASASSRSSLRAALSDADRCINARSAVTTLNRVADERSAQLSQARALAVDALPNGLQIREHLVAALTHSVDADRAFAAWAQNVANGRCGHDDNYHAGHAASQSAQASKRLFCQAWNPVAASQRLPTRTESEV